MYAHEVLMEKEKLQSHHLSAEAQEYLKDFSTFMRGIAMKQGKAVKAGKEFTISEVDMNKSNRLSKSLSQQILSDLAEIQQLAEDKRVKEAEERQAIETARQEKEFEQERLRLEQEEREEQERREREERELQEQQAQQQQEQEERIAAQQKAALEKEEKEQKEEEDDDDEGGIFSDLGFHF